MSRFAGKLFPAGLLALAPLLSSGTAPIDIGSERQLFLDHSLVAGLKGAEFKLGQAVPREVALKRDRPWDGISTAVIGMFSYQGTVHLYYRGMADINEEGKEMVCYARSRDGLHWEKPELGAVEWQGAKANNIVQGPDGGMIFQRCWIFLDPRPEVAESERFKAMAFTYPRGADGKPSGPVTTEIWLSGDGIRFRKSGQPCDLSSARRNAFDGYFVFWSEVEKRFVGYFRWQEEVPVDDPQTHPQWRGRPGQTTPMRAAFVSTSADLYHWSKAQTMTWGGSPREEIYETSVFPYFRAPTYYIGLANRFFHGRRALTAQELAGLKIVPSRNVVGKTNVYDGDINDLVLLETRPGSSDFSRLFMESLVRPGPDPGNWTSRDNYSFALVYPTAPDEMSFLVSRHHRQEGNHIQRFSMRLDGFSSVNAPYAGGEMTTVPVTFAGDRLELNYATAAAGQIQIEIQDPAGHALPGYALSDSAVLIGDRIAGEARWQSGPGVSSLAGRPVRLRFALRDADLYSFRFRPAAP